VAGQSGPLGPCQLPSSLAVILQRHVLIIYICLDHIPVYFISDQISVLYFFFSGMMTNSQTKVSQGERCYVPQINLSLSPILIGLYYRILSSSFYVSIPSPSFINSELEATAWSYQS
jgi:hypothetical protein